MSEDGKAYVKDQNGTDPDTIEHPIHQCASQAIRWVKDLITFSMWRRLLTQKLVNIVKAFREVFNGESMPEARLIRSAVF